jgi:hypothetical protein
MSPSPETTIMRHSSCPAHRPHEVGVAGERGSQRGGAVSVAQGPQPHRAVARRKAGVCPAGRTRAATSWTLSSRDRFFTIAGDLHVATVATEAPAPDAGRRADLADALRGANASVLARSRPRTSRPRPTRGSWCTRYAPNWTRCPPTPYSPPAACTATNVCRAMAASGPPGVGTVARDMDPCGHGMPSGLTRRHPPRVRPERRVTGASLPSRAGIAGVPRRG